MDKFKTLYFSDVDHPKYTEPKSSIPIYIFTGQVGINHPVYPKYYLVAQTIWMFSPGPDGWILNWLRWQLAFQLHLCMYHDWVWCGNTFFTNPLGQGAGQGWKQKEQCQLKKSQNTIKDFKNALQDHISCWIFWISETKNSRRLVPPENNPLSAFSTYMKYEITNLKKKKKQACTKWKQSIVPLETSSSWSIANSNGQWYSKLLAISNLHFLLLRLWNQLVFNVICSVELKRKYLKPDNMTTPCPASHWMIRCKARMKGSAAKNYSCVNPMFTCRHSIWRLGHTTFEFV